MRAWASSSKTQRLGCRKGCIGRGTTDLRTSGEAGVQREPWVELRPTGGP